MISSLFTPYAQGRRFSGKFLSGISLATLVGFWALAPASTGIPTPVSIGVAWNTLALQNGLLVELWNSIGVIWEALKAVVKRALEKLNAQNEDGSWPERTYTRDELFKNKWLDFEDAFRKAGWLVEFDSPGYNESYEPSWSFRAAK